MEGHHEDKSLLSKAAIEVMLQLFINGPTWDGNLISKEGRNELLRDHSILRWNGWQWLTNRGMWHMTGMSFEQFSFSRAAREAQQKRKYMS